MPLVPAARSVGPAVDRAYDYPVQRRALRQRGVTPSYGAIPNTAPALATAGRSSHLRLAPPVKRLLVRYDRRAEIHEAFLALARRLVCFRRLQNSFCFEFLHARERRMGLEYRLGGEPGYERSADDGRGPALRVDALAQVGESTR